MVNYYHVIVDNLLFLRDKPDAKDLLLMNHEIGILYNMIASEKSFLLQDYRFLQGQIL